MNISVTGTWHFEELVQCDLCCEAMKVFIFRDDNTFVALSSATDHECPTTCSCEYQGTGHYAAGHDPDCDEFAS